MNRNVHRQIAEERGVDIRNPSTALFGVSSQDRFKNAYQKATRPSSPFKFTLSSGQNFMNGFFTRVALTEVKFPYAIPTVTTKNNRIQFGWQNPVPGAVTLTVPVGWYTPTTLAAQIQALVLALPGNPVPAFTCVADPVTGFFTAASNNPAISIIFLPFNVPGTQLYNMMNWLSTADFLPTQTSGLPTMLRTQFIDIVCSQLTYNQDVKDGDTGVVTRDILARIYLTPDVDANNPELIGSQPFQIYRQFAFPKQIKWSPNQPITSGLQFEVYDDAGDLLTTGSDLLDFAQPEWNITLLVSEV